LCSMFACVDLLVLLYRARCVCFFFSSRRRHTRLVSDWSSDVCSSDLELPRQPAEFVHLDAMNKFGGLPWKLTFSYGRALQHAPQIGRASCRERGEMSVGGVSLTKKYSEARQSKDGV